MCVCFLLKSLTIAEGGQACTDLILQTIVGLLLRTRPCLYFKLRMLTLGSTDIQRQECLYCFFPEPGRRGVRTVKAKESGCLFSAGALPLARKVRPQAEDSFYLCTSGELCSGGSSVHPFVCSLSNCILSEKACTELP